MAEGRFYLLVLALSSLGSVCVLFTVYWMWNWHGGFAWDGSTLMFNCHPVLMVAGMVVVYSAGECEVSVGGVRSSPSRDWLCPCGLRAVGVGRVACRWAQVSLGGSSSEGGACGKGSFPGSSSAFERAVLGGKPWQAFAWLSRDPSLSEMGEAGLVFELQFAIPAREREVDTLLA